jgi:hypothetical protein
MKILDIAKLSIKQDSALYNSMLGCDLINRLEQREVKAEDTFKKNKNINKNRKG